MWTFKFKQAFDSGTLLQAVCSDSGIGTKPSMFNNLDLELLWGLWIPTTTHFC